MLVRQLEVEVQTSTHFPIERKADVFVQVTSQLSASQAKHRLIERDNIFTSLKTLVTSAGEINPAGCGRGFVAHHPHRKNKSQPGMFSPQRGHIEYAQACARKGHRRIAND